MATQNGVTSEVNIVDIRCNDLKYSLAKDIYDGLNPGKGKQKTLPTILVYDTEGLRLFEEITYLDDYYLTNAEIDALTTHSAKIAEQVPDAAHLVELGSGNLRKIEILLNEFERVKKHVEYSALDLQLDELRRTFAEIPSKSYKYVKCHGLHGTYDDALAWLKNPENRQKPTWILSMGSSIGNFTRSEAADFLKRFAETLGPSDSMLIGLDSCRNPAKVFRAYNDSKGVTRQFYLNGLLHANVVLGFEAFQLEDWDVEGVYDVDDGAHKAFYVPQRDISIKGIQLKKGERIFFEQSFKYGPEDLETLWRKAGLVPNARFGNSSNDYFVHRLSSSKLELPAKAAEYAAHPVPSLQDFESLWKAWDEVTMLMVPRERVLSKPIKLRNELIFYFGHIPTFLDIHLTRATGGEPTEPKNYQLIFERGIDPDVDNPESCHDHSEIPDQWPPLNEILAFQGAVRDRARSLLANGQLAKHNRRIAEALWIGFEHEAMHLETFLYMLLQSDNFFPPRGVAPPNFEDMAKQARQQAVPNGWFTIPEQRISVGLDDPGDLVPVRSFGWDNEKPRREVNVPALAAQARPITNGEYAEYLEANNIETKPASWTRTNADRSGCSVSRVNGFVNGTNHVKNGVNHTENDVQESIFSTYSIRTVFGPVSLRHAADWPVFASYEELAGYARWKGCRIPTFEEVRSIYHHSEALEKQNVNGVKAPTNGYIHETNGANGHANGDIAGGPSKAPIACDPRAPDHQPVSSCPLDRGPVYIDLDGCNVGFSHWHPTPVTQNGDKLSGQGDLGGVWEWTSSPLAPHDGFRAMDLYPGYTADFFDGKHNVVLGGSWATHPRIAGRTSFVNWYQRNYPYTWAGARLVRDV